MNEFLFTLFFPPALAFCVCIFSMGLATMLGVRGPVPWAEMRKVFFFIWQLNCVVNVAILLLPPINLSSVIGNLVSGALSLLLDDNMRKKGKKAAKLVGDKTWLVFESMRERMRVLQPLPGLSSFR